MHPDTEKYFQPAVPSKDLKKKTTRSGAFVILSQVIENVVHLFATVILARLLSPTEFGQLAMVVSVTYLLVIFKDLGLTDATIQRTEITHKQISTLFWINLAIGVLITLIIAGSGPLIAWFYKEPILASITAIWSFHFLLGSATAQHIALMRRAMMFKQTATLTVSSSIFSYVLAIFLAATGAGVWALVLRRVSAQFAVFVGSWYICKWRPGRPHRESNVMPMLHFGKNTVIYFMLTFLTRSIDKILIGWQFGARDLGWYQKAYDIFMIPVQQLSFKLRGVAVSSLSKVKEHSDQFTSGYLKAVSLIAFFSFPFGFYVASASEHITLLLLGPQWGKTAPILGILGCSLGMAVVLESCTWIHSSLGRADRLRQWGIFRMITTVLLVTSGIYFGISGVAVAYAIGFYLLVAPAISYAGKPIGLKFTRVLLAIWRYWGCAAIAFVCTWLLDKEIGELATIYKVITSLLIYGVCYSVLLTLAYGGLKPFHDLKDIISDLLPKSFATKLRNKRENDHP